MDRDNLRMNVLRNALYHTSMWQFFDKLSRSANFIVVMLGASVVGSVATRFAIEPMWIGLIIAALGTGQLVFDFAGSARNHQTLQREYYHLLADFEANLDATEHDLAIFYSRMIRIAGDETPTKRAVDARAYNDALDALGTYDNDQRLIVPVWHRVTGFWFSFDGHNYQKIAELSE